MGMGIMPQFVTRYWQMVVTLFSAAITLGALLTTIRAVERRLDRIDLEGSNTAKDALRRVVVAEQQLSQVEQARVQMAITLGRIEARTESILERVKALDTGK